MVDVVNVDDERGEEEVWREEDEQLWSEIRCGVDRKSNLNLVGEKECTQWKVVKRNENIESLLLPPHDDDDDVKQFLSLVFLLLFFFRFTAHTAFNCRSSEERGSMRQQVMLMKVDLMMMSMVEQITHKRKKGHRDAMLAVEMWKDGWD